jgi:tartrate-resistant acid phosphatase type 5
MSLKLLSRRQAVQGFGLALAAAPFARAWAASLQPPLTFLAVGDWGRDGAFHQAEVAARMGETAAQIRARFVISVGDNFYEDGVTGVDDPKWRTSFENVYTAPSLQTPWQVALGNHDYHGNTQAQLDYAKTSSRWRLPARWRSFTETAPDGATVEFFVLDTSPFISDYYADGATKVKVGGQDIAAQLAWFEAAMARSTADWKLVIGHHPVYSGNLRKGEGGGSPDLVAKLDPILQRHRVPLYLCGHDHDLQHIAHGDTHYVCTGAGSKTRDSCGMEGSDFCSVESGFTAFALTRERLHIAYRDWKGDELHVVDIGRPA